MVKNPPANAGDAGLIPGPGRSPGEGNGNPLQYSCLENPMDGGRLQSMGRKESDTTERPHFTLKGYTSRKDKSKKDQLNSHKGSALTQMRLRWSASILTALQKQKKISGER